MPMAKKRPAKKPAVPTLVHDEDYDQPAAEFLAVLAVGLDLALREAKITDVKTRRKVVDEFCWGAAEFLDTQWIETADGRRHFPVICFTDRHPEQDPPEVRLAPPGAFSFHEYAALLFDDVTNKGKGPYNVTIGDMEDDEAIDLEAE
jgi:hypothetical protein